MNYFCPGSVNTHWGPGPVNTNLVPGPVNTNWGPGPVNTNWGPGPEAGGQAKGRGPGITNTRQNPISMKIFFTIKITESH